MTTTDRDEQMWERGHRAAWVSLLGECLRELDNRGRHNPDPWFARARLVKERENAIAALRRVCDEHGDNDWPDDLYLADIIEKHLERHLEEREPPA